VYAATRLLLDAVQLVYELVHRLQDVVAHLPLGGRAGVALQVAV
jgi:hypothetical protein